MIQYEDFSIKIEPQREDIYPVIVLRSPAGEGRSSFHLPFDPDDLGDLLVDLGQTVRGTGQRPTREAAPGATRTRPQQIGDQLFNTLFSGPVRSLLDQSLGMIHERQKGLRIKLHIDPEDASLARLASLPWELMYRKETRDFLNLSRYTPILRYLDVQVPYVPLKLEPPLRILVVISDPVDCARLDLEHERDQIERTWARQENVEVNFLETPTIAALQERLEREPFHALHFMGHGGFDRRSGSGVLLLQDETGFGVPVDGRTLGVLLRDVPTLRLVFLNACETARVSKQVGLDPFAGVAAAIVMAGVPAVVAMQFPISDVAAIRFAGRFYPLIALGEPVDYAVAEGRRAIRVAESDTMEWATPILFMRAPDGVLFRVAETHRVKRRRPQPPLLDKEVEQRLEQLYIAGLGAFWLEEWDRACHNFQEIVDEQPDYKDATARLEEAEQKWHQNELYSQAQEAQQAGSWTIVLTRLEELVAEDPGYKDSAALLDQARRQKRLADLYSQARQLHQAEQWLAVVRVFDQIAALDPDYPDPDDLLATAQHQAAELQRQAELNDLYRRAVLEMDAGRWEEARQILTRLQEQEAGYREADRLLAKAQAELARQEAEHQRQDQIAALYDRAANWTRVGQWAQALAVMDEIHTLDPNFADPQGIAARARSEVERQRKLEALYAQAQAARNTQDWSQALAALQALVDEDAGYRDAAALLAEVEKQQELASLYAQAQQQHRAGEWQAVVETFARIAEIEPRYADPEGLLPGAERSLAEQQRRAELDDLYNQAAQAMEAGDWASARPLLAQIREREPGYRESEQLLDRAEAELEQAEAERQLREQIATLYEQAQSLARARQWRPALAKIDEIHTLDATFADPESIAARARERVAQEEAEARRQNELAALYAEAVRLLKAEQYQEALQKWGEVQALDARYPDRKKVQVTARKKLARLAKPAARRRLPRWAGIAAGTLIVVASIVAAILIIGTPSTAPPTPRRIPADLGVGTVWKWSDGSAMVYVPEGAFWMGSEESDPDANPDEWPQHQVNLDAFWIDRTEVTNAQYQRCVENGECSPPSDTTAYFYGDYYGESRYADYPVIHIDWTQANAYCTWAGKRLPTEAEWEKAARGTDRRIYPWGNTFDGTLANFCDANCPFPQKNRDWDDGFADTAPVGSYKGGASPYSALDMYGNVHEWTTSLYKSYPYDAADGREDPEAAGQRVVRGGSLGGTPPGMRTATRERRYPTEAGIDLGIRCVRSASEPAQASSVSTNTTLAPTPTPATGLPSPVSDILSNARVMYHDSLDDPSLANWTYETGVLQTADGVLQIQGVANRANQVRPKQDFYGGDAALALFKYDAGANPYLFLETGEWETPTYKRGGISADSYNSVFLTEMYVGTSQVGETPLLGDNTAASSTWHYLLLAIGQDGEFVAQVWPRDDPSRRAEYRHTFGQEWVGHPWTLVLQTDSGNLYIDSYSQIAFSSIVGSTSESIPEGRIAFVSDRDGNLEIYVMNADGSGITNLTNHPGEDRDPAWSPDGTRIAFSSDRGGNEDIWVMNADGSGLVNLTNDPNADRTPAWSPDGTRIAFSSDRAGKGFDDIWVMNADGTEPIQLTDNAANNGGPCWSPDGQRIAFTSGLYSTQNIVVMNADGSEQEVRTSLSINFEPSWSPDGRRIVFGSRRTGNEEIYIMNADGSEQTNLTNNPAIEWYPSWLPDGKHVVFMSDRDGNGEIYIMDADGSNPVRLTVNPAEDSFPAWGP